MREPVLGGTTARRANLQGARALGDAWLLCAVPVSGNRCLATGLGHTAVRPVQRAEICTENPAALATMRKPASKGFLVRACWTWIGVTEFLAVWAYTP